MLEMERKSRDPMETNIDPCLKEGESTAGTIKDLVEIQVDPNEPSLVVKIGKCLSSELEQQLVDFLRRNQDVFAWTHADMVRIHPKIMCHRLNIDPQAKLVPQK